MHEEDTLLRSTRGIAYLTIAPCILLSAAVWFTSDSIGILIANLFQVYFSILMLFLSVYIWSLKPNFEEQYKSQLKIIATKLILFNKSIYVLEIT